MAAGGPEPKAELCFFLGAGASVEAKVPNTVQFVTAFQEWLGSYRQRKLNREVGSAFGYVCSRLSRWVRLRSNAGKQVDVEAVLEAIAILLSGDSQTAAAFLRPRGASAGTPSSAQLYKLQEILKDFIRERCIVDPSRTDYLGPFLRLLDQYRPLHIFSVNYDIVVEQFCDRHQRTYSDGFELHWRPEVFDNAKADVLLYKLHGSVNWFTSQAGAPFKLPVQSTTRAVTLYTGERAESLMLYPAQKLDYSPTILALYDRFYRLIRGASWCVVVGYSFRDPQVVRAFVEIAKENPGLIIILISPSADATYRDKLEFLPELLVDDRNRALELVPSPLSGRVLYLPFEFGRVFASVVTDILPQAKEGRNLELQAINSERYGSTSAWREAALRYVSAGFVERVKIIEREKFKLESEPDDWRLGYLLRKGLMLTAMGEMDNADRCYRATRDILSAWLGRVWINVSGPQLRVQFVFNARLTTDGRFAGGMPGFGIAEMLKPVIELGRRFAVYPGDRSLREKVERETRHIEALSDYLRSVDPQGQPGVLWEDYARARSGRFAADLTAAEPRLRHVLQDYSEASVSAARDALVGIEREMIRRLLEP